MQYHIDKYGIKDFVTKETDNSKSIYCKFKDCIMYNNETSQIDEKRC